MGKFSDTLSSLGRGEDGISVAYPDTFTDDITAAYDEDMSVPTAKISVLEADLAAALSQIDALKAHNYDLLMQVPAAPVEGKSTEDEDELSDDDVDSDSDDDSDLDKVFRD